MINKYLKPVLPLMLAVSFYGFTTKNAQIVKRNYTTKGMSVYYTVPKKQTTSDSVRSFFSINDDHGFIAFKEALGFRESSGSYHAVNTYGYLGKYQFGASTLAMVGLKDTTCFLDTPALQEKAFYANTSRNKWILRRFIAFFNGRKVNGINITESGILAAAHLVGPGHVKGYLRSGGKKIHKDAYGTSIESYLHKFSGYNTDSVASNRRAKAI